MPLHYQRMVVSVPGKLILMGEHAAVYGQPALVAAADPRAQVVVEMGGDGVQIDLADFDLRLDTSWIEARDHARRSRDAWQRYVEEPTPKRFAEVGSGSPADLVLVALGELASSIGGIDLPPLTVRVKSSLPIGSGFGSSASIAVAIIGGLLTMFEGVAEPMLVDRLVLEVERRQHGSPSGVDHKTVLYGGVILAERQPGGDLKISELENQSQVLNRFQVFQTGEPTETTGEVVAAVRRRRDEMPDSFDELLVEMGRDVESFRDEFENRQPGGQRANEIIRHYQTCLEALGVVPIEVCETVRQVEEAGGAAKISGAGALTGDAAGCLLVYWPEAPPEALPSRLQAYQLQPVELGVEGLRVESHS